MGERRVEIVRGVYEGLRARRRTGRARSVVRRVRVVRGRSYGGLYRTREAVTEKLFGPLIEDIPLRGIAGEFIGSEDTVVAVVRYTGSGKATGKQLDLSVVHVWDIRDDKIARIPALREHGEVPRGYAGRDSHKRMMRCCNDLVRSRRGRSKAVKH